MPVLIPAAVLLPAFWLDATPAAHTLHWANEIAGTASTIKQLTIFLVSFIVQT